MEIDITDLVTDNDMFEFSASRMEMGDDAGRITWRNAQEHAKREPLVTTTDQLDEAKRYFRGFGAWSQDEIDAWSPEEVNALLVQYVAGDWRELESLCMGDDGEINWDKARELSEAGTIGGRIYPCDIEGSAEFGRIFVYIGD